MDLWQLTIFVAVVDNKSFSKASEAINLSQPTVSSHIKELEDYFQCRLLDRLGKVTEPTRAGIILYDHARKILALKSQAEIDMHDFLGHAKGCVCVGGSTIPSGYILPRIIGPFSKAFPDVQIHLTAGDSMDIIGGIKDGRIEVGIVGAGTDDPLIRQEKLMADDMRLVVPRDHAWANRDFVTCSELFGETLITREKGSGTWQAVIQSMKQSGFDAGQLQTPITMGNTVSVIQGILHHAGISILSCIAVQDEIDKGRLSALPVKDLDLTRFFYLTTSTRRTLSPICRNFMTFCQDAVSSTGAEPSP